MALAYRFDAISQGPKNSRIPGPNPVPTNRCIISLTKLWSIHQPIILLDLSSRIHRFNSGIGLSYRPATRYDNPMLELTLSPSRGSVNSATGPSEHPTSYASHSLLCIAIQMAEYCRQIHSPLLGDKVDSPVPARQPI
jgi:hypothetical protein